MKIAIDCRMLDTGGIGSYLASLLPFFIKNNECILIGNRNKLVQYTNENTEIIDCNIKTFSIKDTFFFPKSLLKKINHCDIFYSPYCNIPQGIKVPVFTTIHDVVFLDIPDLAGKIGTFARKWFYQRAINKSKIVFTVSEFSKNRIAENLKANNNNLVVTYNALPPWLNSDSNTKHIKKDYILYVGNIKKHKGLHTLIAAYKKLMSANFYNPLYIVGNAENFRTTDETISAEIEDLSSFIKFTGRVSDTELHDLYCNAKLLIQPSLYEGFGMPPLEAISSGTNAIISNIPVFKEIYEKLPVIFFEKENSDDLAEKILRSYDLPSPVISENPYSFERTYNIIINTINN